MIIKFRYKDSNCYDYLTAQWFYEGPAKSFVTEFGLLQCYVLSNIFLLQTFMWYLLETLINSAAKRTSRRILISRKHFLKP